MPQVADRKSLDIELALIGAGHMGEALLKGILNARLLQPSQLVISDLRADRLGELKSEYGVKVESANDRAASQAQAVVLAVKPDQIKSVIDEIKGVLNEGQVLISVAAGISTQTIYDRLEKKIPVVRVMPNQPALVGRAMSVLSPGQWASTEAVSLAKDILSGVGEVVVLDERFQNLGTALSGSGPAYFYLLVRALVEGGVKGGLGREIATELVVETMIGAGAVLKETSQRPGALIEQVASPGGTTEAALAVFEDAGFESTVDRALEAAVARAEQLA